MSDVVLKMPLLSDEVQLFSNYLNRFLESRSAEAERMAEGADAPLLMVSNDPLAGEDHRIVIFQEPSIASAFSSGWAALRRGMAREGVGAA